MQAYDTFGFLEVIEAPYNNGMEADSPKAVSPLQRGRAEDLPLLPCNSSPALGRREESMRRVRLYLAPSFASIADALVSKTRYCL